MIKKLMCGLAGIAVAGVAQAKPILEQISSEITDIATVVGGAVFLVGMGLGAMAALKFKAHNEDPHNTNIAAPFVMAGVSACLLGLSALSPTTTGTPFDITNTPSSTTVVTRKPIKNPAVPAQEPSVFFDEKPQGNGASDSRWVPGGAIK